MGELVAIRGDDGVGPGRSVAVTTEVHDLMELDEPFVGARGLSDHWLYAELFSSTCPVMINKNDTLIGAVIAFRSQHKPS